MIAIHDTPTMLDTPAARLRDAARRLSIGEELDTEALVLLLAANGKSVADLRVMCEQFGAEMDARRTVFGDLGRGGLSIPQF